MLDVMLPGDGWVVALAEVYIDESYRPVEGGRLLCVAGYLFRRRGAKGFAKSWTPYLTKKKGLPHFHMTDLVSRQDVYEGRKDTDEIARRLISDTTKWSAYGFSVTVDEGFYNRELAGKHGLAENAYGFALLQAMIMVARWVDRSGFDGEIAYFFESGHQHQSDAERFLGRIVKSEKVKARYRYRAHAFVPKATPWLHPADMLAWEWGLESARRSDPDRRPVRKSLEAMVRPQDMCLDYTSPRLAELALQLEAEFGGRKYVAA